MEYKIIGNTDLLVSRIGFGCYPIGGWDWGKVNDQDSINAVRSALDLGVNFFDTADIYGLGHSEEVLSKALKQQRKKVIIATKGGLKWDNHKKIRVYDLSAKYLFSAVEQSLKRLGLDCILLYQIHYPDPNVAIEETMGALEKLKEQGKIRYIGVSNMTAELIREYLRYGRIESVQLRYNILDYQTDEAIFSLCKKNNLSVFSYGSLAQGLLTGKYNRDSHFEENDHRSRDSHFQSNKFFANLTVVEQLKEIANKYGMTCAQLAISWILHNQDIATALVGVKNPKQIEQNVHAFNWGLEDKDYNLILELVRRSYVDSMCSQEVVG